MSLLLRTRSAWRAHGARIASQHIRASSLPLLPVQAQSQWPSRRNGAVCTPPASAFSIGSLRALSSTAAPSPSPLTASSAADAASDTTKQDALVDRLRPLCRSLYSEHRDTTKTIEQLLAPWATQITALLEAENHAQSVKDTVAQTYEQGVAIAFKQREFDLAQALIHQMQTLGLVTHDALVVYQIRAVPLQRVTRGTQLPLDELRALELGPNWENAVLQLVHSEGQPHYRKSPAERDQFQRFVTNGVVAVLAEYEKTVPLDSQSIAPYNAALRTFASCGLPFAQMLRVLNHIPQNSHARRTLNVETFLALLHGARWNDIPLTIERLVKSNVLRQLQHPEGEIEEEEEKNGETVVRRRCVAAQMWDQAMRSICNSHTDRFFDKRTPLDKRRMRDLQTIFIDVDAQLQRVFPDKHFATIDDLTAVYEVRIKAAALLGLPRQVHSLLNEYKALAPVEVASGQLGRSVFLKALEIFPSVGLKRVHPSEIERVRSHPEVVEAPEIVELQRAIEDLEQNTIPAKKLRKDESQTRGKGETVEGGDVGAQTAGRELRKAQQMVVKLKKRLHDLRQRVAIEVAHQHRMRAADKSIDIILDHMKNMTTTDPHQDLEVAVAIMTQYMTVANRYAARMSEQTREFMAAQIMLRVFELLDKAVGHAPIPSDTSTDDRLYIEQLFSLASKTGALFWCEDDLETLLQRKKAVLGSAHWSAEDYDRVVFMRVAQHDIDGAIKLLHDMHYAGVSPTPTTIHRVVTGVLHKLYRGGKKHNKNSTTESDTDDLGEDFGEDDDDLGTGVGAAAGWSTGPSRLEDIAGFIQEWYNLYNVKPMAKTVVPVFARLLASNNVWEVKRLLQILDAMDGGLSPVTEFWLEKRLAAVGKSVDDLRITPKHR